jgi:hypothetical protein
MLKLTVAAGMVAGSLVTMSATGVAQMSQASSKEHEGRRICRSSQETGKLASRRRVCLTKAEWDRAAEEGRRSGQTWVAAMDACGMRGEAPGDC